jgi:hypothetical protein
MAVLYGRREILMVRASSLVESPALGSLGFTGSCRLLVGEFDVLMHEG